MKKIIVFFLLSSFILSCGVRKEMHTKKVVQKKEDKNSLSKLSATEAYIVKYKEIAQKEMTLYNIPASITLAQGILESGSGKGRLSVKANNHFGIKCHTWTGAKIYHDDDKNGECFRKYNNPKYSFRDHSLFLTTRKRYSGLFKLKITNYKAWAKGLKAAGYATDRKYPQKLINLIELYKLYKYDDEVLGRNPSERKFETEENEVYVVKKGDTLYNISKKYNLTVKELQELNNITDTNIGIGQVLKIK